MFFVRFTLERYTIMQTSDTVSIRAATGAPITYVLAAHLTSLGSERSTGLSGFGQHQPEHAKVQRPKWHSQLHAVQGQIDRMLVGTVAQRFIASGELSVHVLHDASDLNVSQHRGVELHQLRGRLRYNPNDGRWNSYGEVIDTLRASRRIKDDSCIFAIDLGDVRIIGNLSRLCDQAQTLDTLFVGTDVCTKHGKSWLYESQIPQANYSVSPVLRDWLHGNQRFTSSHNCGVLGARLHTFEHFRAAYVARIQSHYQNAAARATGVVDMLVFNELIAESCQCGGVAGPVGGETGCNCTGLINGLIRGYPYGRVNLPMFGLLCYYHGWWAQQGLLTPCFCNTSKPDCRLCPTNTIAAMQHDAHGELQQKHPYDAVSSNYFFTHHLGCGTPALPCP